ncbi:hypothetical protein BMF94_4618 [Rhodotorula taiwanensis]|uniref:PCI domain-containing protein n=1 Tax=Rhodotorula taiwanensis TaxID=741276 RepID=A0A2S5B6E2_9BASI|nr:hypothetical protein BMF94_4618 [Rhodotorula taiwanensis]
MADLQDDFAAYTTIGERVAVPQDERKPVQAKSAGPAFTLPPALEPFILLSKSARGAGAAGLVEKATAAPGVYVFAELLNQPSIKDLANQEQHQRSYRLLELFAYGTWTDYDGARDQFPKLTLEHETKLKHLTVLSLATESRVIPYSTLLSTLSLDSVPQLEDLLIELFYANALTGRLDQKHSRLEVVTSLGRDVRRTTTNGADDSATISGGDAMQVDSRAATATTSGGGTTSRRAPSLASLHATLSSWQATLLNLIHSLEDHLGAIHAETVNGAQVKYEHEQRVREVAAQVANKGEGGKGGKGKGSSAMTAAGGGGGGGWKATSGAGAGGGGDDDEDDQDGPMDIDPAAYSAMAGGGLPVPPASPGQGGGGGGGSHSGRTRKRGRM